MAFSSNPYSLPLRFSSSFHAFNFNKINPLSLIQLYKYMNIYHSLIYTNIILVDQSYMSFSLSKLTSLKMEQYSQYLMLVKSKNNKILMNPLSWEEQAFAQDAGGPLGGFVWPPRSYSCSFCRREFRSAQALGGHMNVHRRERAKLKQTVNGTTSAAISTTTTTITTTAQNHNKQMRGSLIPALGQESLDSNSDTKSCVYDEELVVAHGNGDHVETKLFLGFDYLDSSTNTASAGCKRQKTAVTTPVMTKGLDLELRLAS